MTHRPKKTFSKILFYIVLSLSVLAMIGFGITGIFSPSTSATVATVGDEEVTAEEYFRTLQQEIRNASQQVGQTLTISDALQYGLDRQVLQQLITEAAMRGETKRLGISVSDATVQAELLSTPAFQGIGGAFDPDVYRDILKRSGLTPAEYESLIRADKAQEILRTAVTAGARLPDDALNAVFDYMGETRSFTYARLGAENLSGPTPAPAEADLKAYYDAHPDEFTQPLTRHITYVSLTPEQVAAKADVSEDAIKSEYEARAEQYHSPAKRFVDRLVYLTEAEAKAARARIDSGEATFDDLVKERNLTPADTDLGEVTAGDVGKAAADVLFASSEPGIYGPVQSDIGPALFRVNAVIDASEVPLDAVRDEIRHEIALQQAGGKIAEVADQAIDLIAGGATIEEVANETDMELGKIDLAEGDTDGIAAYAKFRDEASAADIGEERDIVDLSDGGIVALRVDDITEPFVKPFDQVRDEVAAKWTAQKTQERIMARAQQIAAAIKASNGGSLADFGNSLHLGDATDIGRTSQVPDLPPAVVPAAFKMEPGEVKVFENFDGAVIVQLNNVTPFNPEDPRVAASVQQITAQTNDLLKQDLLTYYGAALVNQAKPTINKARIDALHTQLN